MRPFTATDNIQGSLCADGKLGKTNSANSWLLDSWAFVGGLIVGISVLLAVPQKARIKGAYSEGFG